MAKRIEGKGVSGNGTKANQVISYVLVVSIAFLVVAIVAP